MSRGNDRNASRLTAAEAAARYEAVDADRLNDWLRDLLPEGRGCVLDVGAGSGRDAAWLAGLGHEVVAVEPDGAMRWQAEQMHPDRRFELLPDRLPETLRYFPCGALVRPDPAERRMDVRGAATPRTRLPQTGDAYEATGRGRAHAPAGPRGPRPGHARGERRRDRAARPPARRLRGVGFGRIGFAKEALQALSGRLSGMDLRPGARVAGDQGAMLHGALRDACSTIDRMPATFLAWPDGSRIFPARRRTTRKPGTVVLDGDYLRSFGTLHVPHHLWRAMQRCGVWIEPALVEEWIGLTAGYAQGQSRTLDERAVRDAMRWYEPERDRRTAKKRVDALLEGQSHLYCVWTGKRLRKGSVDIDHCFPWSAWPCDDLWNLMPATRQVNQREKGDLLPDDRTLRGARDRILEWWELGYCSERVLDERFRLEAGARLPALGGRAEPDDIFTAMSLQRMRLSNDQQVPEWAGPT